VKVRITARARSHVRGRQAWWAQHRPAAVALFDEELEQALHLVREMPGAGAPWPTERNPGLRRVLMPRTHSHLYFYFDEKARTVVVLAVWGAARGRAPKL
jgi:plasmid stabilization system protein ParE